MRGDVIEVFRWVKGYDKGGSDKAMIKKPSQHAVICTNWIRSCSRRRKVGIGLRIVISECKKTSKHVLNAKTTESSI